MITCIIIDDDVIALKNIEKLCLLHGGLNLMGSFLNATEALSFMEEHKEAGIDLVFLDVERSESKGMDMLENMPFSPIIIFISGNAEYAIDAFEYNAIDFLKKPVSLPRFQNAVLKAQDYQNYKAKVQQAAKEQSTDIFIRDGGKLIRVPADEILFFENVGDYIRVKTSATQYIIYGTLKGIDAKLNDPRFLKIHRSFIVNTDKITQIQENTLSIEKNQIPISRSARPELVSRLKIL
jgi:DNA-binding LytR/AlgR family response regulator